jgi:predicted nucleotidyltransferase
MYLMDSEKQKLAEILSAEPAVEMAYLYGSFATGLATQHSDIDIGVLVKPKYASVVDFKFESSLAEKSEGILESHKEVDLRVINKAPLHFQYQVIKPGMVLYAANDKNRVEFETYVISRYLDMKYYWNLYDKYRRQRLERGEFGVGFKRNKVTS